MTLKEILTERKRAKAPAGDQEPTIVQEQGEAPALAIIHPFDCVLQDEFSEYF